MTTKMTLGIDLGDKHSHPCLLDGDCAIVRPERVQTQKDTLERFFARLAADVRPVVVIEAGVHSQWVSERAPRPSIHCVSPGGSA